MERARLLASETIAEPLLPRLPFYVRMREVTHWDFRDARIQTARGLMYYEKWCYLEANRIASLPQRSARVDIKDRKCCVVANVITGAHRLVL